MPILDFKEIPSSNVTKSASGEQDTFELFARDFLEMLGYKIISPPNRGADRGKDIIVEETRRGVGGESRIRWLVSCKHYAHSGSSITPDKEQNIKDRTKANQCEGFIGFYSTLPSSGLTSIIEGLNTIEHQIYDKERIESYILGDKKGIKIAKRYFPKSIQSWENDHKQPADISLETPTLNCQYTGENLLKPEPRGIIVFGRNMKKSKIIFYEDIYWCLKGEPDRILKEKFRSRGLITSWEDIPDLIIPDMYLKFCLGILNQLKSRKYFYSEVAFYKIKEFLMATFPYVARNATNEEKKRIKSLQDIPFYL